MKPMHLCEECAQHCDSLQRQGARKFQIKHRIDLFNKYEWLNYFKEQGYSPNQAP